MKALTETEIQNLLGAEITSLWVAPAQCERPEQARVYLAALFRTVAGLKPDAGELAAAWQAVRVTWRAKHWPSPAVICSAIETVREERRHEWQTASPKLLAAPDDGNPDGPGFDRWRFDEAMRICQERAPRDSLFASLLAIGEGLQRKADEWRIINSRRAA